MIGRRSSANRWSSSFIAPSNEGACDPDDPAVAAACDDDIEANIDSAADVEAPDDEVDGPAAPIGGGISRPEVLSALMPTAHGFPALIFMFHVKVEHDKTNFLSFWRSAPLAH